MFSGPANTLAGARLNVPVPPAAAGSAAASAAAAVSAAPVSVLPSAEVAQLRAQVAQLMQQAADNVPKKACLCKSDQPCSGNCGCKGRGGCGPSCGCQKTAAGCFSKVTATARGAPLIGIIL